MESGSKDNRNLDLGEEKLEDMESRLDLLSLQPLEILRKLVLAREMAFWTRVFWKQQQHFLWTYRKILMKRSSF